jgi:hypothetical protein
MIKDDKKHEIDDHGDRVYEMMVARYGIGSVDVIETPSSLQGGRPNFVLHAKNEGDNDGLGLGSGGGGNFNMIEDIIKNWDHKYFIGQFAYVMAATAVFILMFHGVFKSSSHLLSSFFASLTPHHHSSSTRS